MLEDSHLPIPKTTRKPGGNCGSTPCAAATSSSTSRTPAAGTRPTRNSPTSPARSKPTPTRSMTHSRKSSAIGSASAAPRTRAASSTAHSRMETSARSGSSPSSVSFTASIAKPKASRRRTATSIASNRPSRSGPTSCLADGNPPARRVIRSVRPHTLQLPSTGDAAALRRTLKRRAGGLVNSVSGRSYSRTEPTEGNEGDEGVEGATKLHPRSIEHSIQTGDQNCFPTGTLKWAEARAPGRGVCAA